MEFQVADVRKTYGRDELEHAVLRDLRFEIGVGEFIAVMGTSGSGKTTLLNILGGLDRTYSGSVRADGVELSSLSDAKMAAMRNERFGFVFQQFHLLDHFTSAENVALPQFFDRRARSDERGRQRAEELLERVGLADKIEARPPQLSGGQKQRVAIARALFNAPSVIFCDEPTGSLDRATGLQILQLFEQLNAEGITIVLVTHEEHIARMAKRILTLEDGALISDQSNAPVTPQLTTLRPEEE